MKLENVQKIYNPNTPGAVKALNGIDLCVEKGEMIAVQGTSGAGKSTLLHILGCIDRLSSGRYFLYGEDITLKNDKYLSGIRNKKIGFVLQDFALIPYRSVIDNVSVPLIFGDTRLSQISDKCVMALKMVDMHGLRSKKVSQLSGGQKQRVAIARAIVNDPEIILADEPTGSLDSKNAENIMNILLDLNSHGKTIIIVTHDNNIASYCFRKIILSDGKIVHQESSYTIQKNQHDDVKALVE
jgi:putative ABC transport system ATP-binding protein